MVDGNIWKQDYIRMLAERRNCGSEGNNPRQIDKVNENRLELAEKQSLVCLCKRRNYSVSGRKIKQQDIEFANNSDRIFQAGRSD
ncbi:MAG: hypothetical protein ACLRMN_07505 [Mediterraneibacter gnavus]